MKRLRHPNFLFTMKTLWIFFFFLLSFTPSQIKAYVNDYSLKIGPSLSLSSFRSQNRASSPRGGIGFHTHMSYKWVQWEFTVSSYIHVHPINSVSLQARESQIEGKFYFRSLTLALLAKYHTPFRPISPLYPLYVMIGPALGHQSLKTHDVYITRGSYEPHHKITLESIGGVLGFGIEEEVSKKNYNLFIELIGFMLQVRRIEVVGGTHAKVETLSREKYHGRSFEYGLQLNIGIIIF